MLSNIDTNGLIMVLIGLLIRFIVGRRRFMRRNVAGLLVYPSYMLSLVIPLVEWFFNLLALLLIIWGLFILLI